MINVLQFTNGVITTKTVQAAIDAAAKERRVLYFPNGTYTVAALQLRTDSRLYLDKDATIEASIVAEDWEDCQKQPFISALGAENVSIIGGHICCNGPAFLDEFGHRAHISHRPERTVWLRQCKNVTLQNLKLSKTVGWTLHLDDCDDVLVDSIVVRNPGWLLSENSDGIDINGCRNVTVINCDVETGDDAICLKNVDYTQDNESGKNPRPDMYGIYVYNCRLATTCNATKIGTETVGNIYDVHFEKIYVCKHSSCREESAGDPPRVMINPLSAVSVQSNDGAKVHDLTFKNYHVEHTNSAFVMVLQKRERFSKDFPLGEVYNVSIENVTVERAYRNSVILAQDGMCIHDVRIRDLHVNVYEAPSDVYAPNMPDGKVYPDIHDLGRFPVYGVYQYNTKDVTIEDSTFADKANSGREAFMKI